MNDVVYHGRIQNFNGPTTGNADWFQEQRTETPLRDHAK